jgi:hypothetical protein
MPANQPSMATALAGASMRILSIVLLARLNLSQFHSRYHFRMNLQ